MLGLGWAIPSLLTVAALAWATLRQNEHPMGYGGVAVLGRGLAAGALFLLSWTVYFLLMRGPQ
jgi:hypothetical protein